MLRIGRHHSVRLTIATGAVRWTSTSATERHNILPGVDGSFAKHDTLIKSAEKVPGIN